MEHGNILGTLAIYLIVLLVVFLVCREIVCWYWKINKSIELLTQIRDLLVNNASLKTSPNLLMPAADDTSGSLSAAQNLSDSGHTAAQISKELQKWRGLAQAEADVLANAVTSRCK